MRESRRISYDEPISIPTKVLSKELLTLVFGSVKTKRRLVAEKILTPSTTNPEMYFPTLAGVLHFCEYPQRSIPEAVVLCTQFKGTSGRDIIQTQEVTGNLEQQIAISLQLVLSWISRHFKLQGAKLTAKPLIPREALREAIINALVHRKYWVPGAVKIAVYEDRVEVFSPGQLPGLVDLKQLGDGTTFLCNPNIANLARKWGLVEKMGTGIRLIFDSCQKAGLKPPQFHEEGDFVKVVFFFQSQKN